MNDEQLQTVAQVRQFLERSEAIEFRYHRLKRGENTRFRSIWSFWNISQMSVAHLYNLRRSSIYRGIARRFIKTRPRHTNDNGLVETKNGAVVHKKLGYTYIPQRCAEVINRFNLYR